MSFNHRLPAVAMATLASLALTLCVLSAMVCDFVEVNARPGALVVSANNEQLVAVRATFGVFCQDLFYDGEDTMWDLSQIFFYISSSLGGIAVVLAWAVSIVIPPTFFNWRLLSVLCALSAVLQVPIFLILEAGPCRMSEVQTCSLSKGSYYLIVSTLVWVAVTFGTQFLDPPLWAVELSAWRIQKNRRQHPIIEETDEELGIDQSRVRKNKADGKQSRKDQHRSLPSDISLPAVSTESMKDEDFDFTNPSRSSDNSDSLSREVTRPANNNPNGDTDKLSQDISDLTPRYGDEGWIDHVPTKSIHGDVSFFQSSIPSQTSERVHILPSESKAYKEAPKSPKSPDRRSRSGSVGSKRSRSRVPVAAPTSSIILADLNAHSLLVLSSPLKDTRKEKDSDRIPLTSTGKNATEKYSLTIRALTRKLKNDSRRRHTRRQRRRNGYENMLDDDDDDSDDDYFMSPPIEVKIQPFANFESADFHQEFTDDENEDLMDGWKALHKATAAGVRNGLQEEYSQNGEKIDFDFPVQEYHSDPELAYHSSDSSRSHVSLPELNGSRRPIAQDQEDNSTLSGSSGSRAKSVDGKKSRGRTTRRKRKPNSPNVSVKSGGSLLDVTIDEETDQDVMEEISVGEEGIKGILGAYKMERTLSEPLPRQTDYLLSRQARENVETISLDKSRLRTTQQSKKSPKVVGFASALERRITTPSELVATTQMTPPKIQSTPNDLSLPGLNNIERNDFKFPQQRRPSGSTSESQASPLRKYLDVKSHSPGSLSTMDVESLKDDIGVVLASNRSTMVPDEESTTQSVRSTRSSESNLSKRAREYRIKRMQHRKHSADTRTTGTSSTQGGLYSASDVRKSAGKDPQPISSSVSPPLYDDEQGNYPDIVPSAQSPTIDSHAVPPTAGRHVDFSGLIRDASPTNLPKFTARDSSYVNYSPTPEGNNRVSPELTPILHDETEKMDRENNFPTITTTASSDSPTPEYTSFGNYDAEAIDVHPEETDIGLIKGMAHHEDSSQEQYLGEEDFGNYGSFEMDELDLQLIAVRRPIGKEYGEDEVSL